MSGAVKRCSCGAFYWIDEKAADLGRCNPCEIVRLREELGEMRLVLDSQDFRLKEFKGVNDRLLGAMTEIMEWLSPLPKGERLVAAAEAVKKIAREGR